MYPGNRDPVSGERVTGAQTSLAGKGVSDAGGADGRGRERKRPLGGSVSADRNEPTHSRYTYRYSRIEKKVSINSNYNASLNAAVKSDPLVFYGTALISHLVLLSYNHVLICWPAN